MPALWQALWPSCSREPSALVRIWLPLTGRLPWNTIAFLDDAYRRGALRQAGAVYQFRHIRLKHHLGSEHRR